MDKERLQALRERRAAEAAQQAAEPAPAAAPSVPKYSYDSSSVPQLPEFMDSPGYVPPVAAREPSTLDRFKSALSDAKQSLSEPSWYKNQLMGALHGANQVATGGFADEIGGTLEGSLENIGENVYDMTHGVEGNRVTPGMTTDKARADARATARDAVDKGTAGAVVGGIVGGAPLAAATGGGSLAEQTGAAGLSYLTNLMGHGEGEAGDRAQQATQHLSLIHISEPTRPAA
jgi:hypothetical protein